MKLSARMLTDVGGVNIFEPSLDGIKFSPGDAPTLYFQLIDISLDSSREGFSPPGRRYMPATGTPDAALSVTFESIDDDREVTRACSQPFPEDPSIWSVSILATDNISGTVNMALTLTEPVSGGPTTKVTRGLVKNALRVCD